MKGGWNAHDHKQLSIMTKYTTYKGYHSHNDVEAKKMRWMKGDKIIAICLLLLKVSAVAFPFSNKEVYVR